MKVVALIPLRGGSKSIPRKNIKDMGGKPLCSWVIEAAVDCQEIDQVVVSTEDHEIASVVESLGLDVTVLNRPEDLATDDASTESVMVHAKDNLSFDALVTIQATSPLLESVHLSEGLALYDSDNLDSLLSAVRLKRFFWSDDNIPLNYDPQNRPRRQEFDGVLMENGAFYITSYKLLCDTSCRLGGNVGIYEMPESTAFEIDDPLDWEYVSHIIENRLN